MSVDGNVVVWIGIWNVYGYYVSCGMKTMSVRDAKELQ